MKSSILLFVTLLIQEVVSESLNPGILQRSKRQFDFLKQLSMDFSNPTFNCVGNSNCGINVGNSVHNNQNDYINGNKVEMNGGNVNGGINIGGLNSGGSNPKAGAGNFFIIF